MGGRQARREGCVNGAQIFPRRDRGYNANAINQPVYSSSRFGSDREIGSGSLSQNRHIAKPRDFKQLRTPQNRIEPFLNLYANPCLLPGKLFLAANEGLLFLAPWFW